MSVVKLIDEMTLRSIVEQGHGVSFECDNCWRLVAVDVLDLIGRFGAAKVMGRGASLCRPIHERQTRCEQG
jgi:hypothetical protein